MAVRQEELLVREAVIYRFPTEAIAIRRVRRTVLRRRQITASIAAIVISVGLLVVSGPAPDAAGRAGVRRVVVAPGQTLWGIAEAHAPDRTDPRAYIDELQDLNGLDGPIRPGMRLKLPR